MQHWKIDEYQRVMGRQFPPFRALSRTEARDLGRVLLSRLGFSGPLDARLWSAVTSALQTVPCNACDNAFSLDIAFSLAGVVPSSELYVWWQQEEEEIIDVFTTRDAVRLFKEIWRPSSDDIDLFDGSLTWMLRVDHGGFVSLIDSGAR